MCCFLTACPQNCDQCANDNQGQTVCYDQQCEYGYALNTNGFTCTGKHFKYFDMI